MNKQLHQKTGEQDGRHIGEAIQSKPTAVFLEGFLEICLFGNVSCSALVGWLPCIIICMADGSCRCTDHLDVITGKAFGMMKTIQYRQS